MGGRLGFWAAQCIPLHINADPFFLLNFSSSMPVGHAFGIATNAALDAGHQGRPVSG
jgi:hypothetical protein